MADTTLDGRDDKSKWQPEPLKEDGIYFWPIRPRTTLQWLKGYFFSPISLFHTALPLLTWFYLTPDLASMKTFELDWIVIIFIRNVVLLTPAQLDHTLSTLHPEGTGDPIQVQSEMARAQSSWLSLSLPDLGQYVLGHSQWLLYLDRL